MYWAITGWRLNYYYFMPSHSPPVQGGKKGGDYSFVFKHFINVYKRIQTRKQNKDETLCQTCDAINVTGANI